MIPCPKVDQRDAEQVVAQVRTLLPFYVPDLQSGKGADQLVEAITRIFARYGELIIDRLNRAPEKNFLAFLNLAGISPLPPRAARVPLTFYLSSQTVSSAVVLARTQVAAELAKGETSQVLFETESELVVVAARLQSLLFKNGGLDRYRDWTAAIGPATPPESGTAAVASAPARLSDLSGSVSEAQLLPHRICIGMPLRPRWPQRNQLCLRFLVDESLPPFPDHRAIQWELCQPVALPSAKSAQLAKAGAEFAEAGANFDDAMRRTPITPQVDETEGFARSGHVIFVNLPQPDSVTVEGFSGFWICCRLLNPLARSDKPAPGMVRGEHIPLIRELSVESEFEEEDVPVDFILANNAAVDATKEFFPFGERPKFGDTLYLASNGFSDPAAQLTVQVELANPSGGKDSPITSVAGQNVKLGWEYWDGREWAPLGVGESTSQQEGRHVHFLLETPAAAQESKFVDTTQAFTHSGLVSFHFDGAPALSVVNGKKAYWIRVRILAGDYGRDAFYQQNPETGKYTITPASFAPPSIRSIKVAYKVKTDSPAAAIATFNDFVSCQVQPGEAFRPFVPTADADLLPSLYLGFLTPVSPAAISLPDLTGLPFPARSMSLFVGLGQAESATGQAPEASTSSSLANWEYWNGSAWTKWTVRDGTLGFKRSGLVRILAPADYRMRREFGLDRYWLRMRSGTPSFDPQIRNALLNTTMAQEGSTQSGEVLGASNGQPNQVFRATRAPVLDGQQLEVLEPFLPAKQEQRVIAAEEGADAIPRASGSGGSRGHTWIRWHEVPNFDASGPRDRHYALDRLIGEVRFGDGKNGQIPPALPGNIRMAFYRAGGGAKGNRPPLTIKQLKSAVPYIGKVLNWEEAGGGGDPETTSALLERGPRFLRHRNRAVTAQDFEDLAMAASSQVARARCFPLRDLGNKHDRRKRPGIVGVVIVPRSSDPAPIPGDELLDCVRLALSTSCSPLLQLVLAGPEYVAVDVETEITVADPDAATEIELAATLALQAYLHPVTGGRDSAGWDFGREPQKSDLWELLEDIPGVDHVRSLKLQPRWPPGADESHEQYLVCAGSHKIITTLQD